MPLPSQPEVLISNQQEALPIDPSKVEEAVLASLEYLKLSTDQISICFVTVDEICRIHEEAFGDPSPTDCMTFPVDQEPTAPPHFLGECIICPQVAMERAAEEGGTPDSELLLYLVHTLLHLAGFRDQEEADIAVMRKKEQEVLHHLADLGIDLRVE